MQTQEATPVSEQQAAEIINQVDALGRLSASAVAWLQVVALLLLVVLFFLAIRRRP